MGRLSIIVIATAAASLVRGELYAAPSSAEAPKSGSCFLLFDLDRGEIGRAPSEICEERISPASTFKIPHALAALDAGVVTADESLPYRGAGNAPESWKHSHTIGSAIRNSVVWFFQEMAKRLGAQRESGYLQSLRYGNMDPSSGLTTFWLGGSLLISPDEQEQFLLRLYRRQLPVKPRAMDQILKMLVQPRDHVVNAAGEHEFAAPWPEDAEVSAKTGAARDTSGRDVRWLVGYVARTRHQYIFVSCVIGSDLDSNVAIDLAAQRLREEHVL